MKSQTNHSRSEGLLRATQKALLVTTLLTAGTGAHAAAILYDNTVNFTGFGVSNGNSIALSTGVQTTVMVADDVNLVSGSAGKLVSTFSFSVSNFNATPVTARVRVRFYGVDPVTGGPGTVLAGFSFAAFSQAVGVSTYFTNLAVASQWAIPANEKIWAGMFFDNSGASATTAAQLNNLGQGTFNPPTIGSSTDTDFLSTAPTTAGFLFNNPGGTIRTSPFGGNPVASYGWKFGTNETPAPSSLAVLALGGLPLLSVLRRRRAARN